MDQNEARTWRWQQLQMQCKKVHPAGKPPEDINQLKSGNHAVIIESPPSQWPTNPQRIDHKQHDVVDVLVIWCSILGTGSELNFFSLFTSSKKIESLSNPQLSSTRRSLGLDIELKRPSFDDRSRPRGDGGSGWECGLELSLHMTAAAAMGNISPLPVSRKVNEPGRRKFVPAVMTSLDNVLADRIGGGGEY